MKEVFDTALEVSAAYNVAVLQDDLVKLQLRALTFRPNLNNFQFKPGVLHRVHTNAFGETIPAYKSFERQLVNRNHNMTDSNPRATNEPIGYIERAEIRDDGVYLTAWIWKRALSESELSQLRKGSAKVSMECEYTEPRVKFSDGTERALTPGQGVPERAVRTMSDDSVVSFIGLGVLFDGVNPADPYSGVLHVENAMVDPIVLLNECEGVSPEVSQSQGGNMDNLQDQLSVLQRQLEEAKAAQEQAEKALQEKADATKSAEDEMTSLRSQLESTNAELQIAKRQVFEKNLSSVVDLAALPPDLTEWVLKLFVDACGDGMDEAKFTETSSKLKVLSAALKRKKGCGSVTPEEATVETPTTPEVAEAAPAVEQSQEAVVPKVGASIASAPKPETRTFSIYDL